MPTVTEIIYFACCLSHIQFVFKSTSCSHSSFPTSAVRFLSFLKVVLLPNTLLVLFITVLSCPYFNPKPNNFHHILHSNIYIPCAPILHSDLSFTDTPLFFKFLFTSLIFEFLILSEMLAKYKTKNANQI